MLALCLAALLTGQTADTVTTARLLRLGYHEANPMMPSSVGGIVTVKAGVTTAMVVTGWKLRKHRPKTAAAVFLLGAVAGTAGAWHNARIRQR